MTDVLILNRLLKSSQRVSSILGNQVNKLNLCADLEVTHSNTEESVFYFIREKHNLFCTPSLIFCRMSRSANEIHLLFLLISDIYCGLPNNFGILGSPSVFSRGSTVRHLLITKLRPMNEFGRVTVTTKLGPAIIVLWLIFSRSNSTMTGAGIEPATSSTEVRWLYHRATAP